VKYRNDKCSCGFDLSSAEPGLHYRPGEYIGHCPSCHAPQPVVKEVAEQVEPSEPAEPEPPAEPVAEPETE